MIFCNDPHKIKLKDSGRCFFLSLLSGVMLSSAYVYEGVAFLCSVRNEEGIYKIYLLLP